MVQDGFFLREFKDDFVVAARGFVSEVHVKIHQRIDIGDLSERLHLGREEGERWIVNLIREMRMGADAKIDLKKVRYVRSRPSFFFLGSFCNFFGTLCYHHGSLTPSVPRNCCYTSKPSLLHLLLCIDLLLFHLFHGCFIFPSPLLHPATFTYRFFTVQSWHRDG